MNHATIKSLWALCILLLTALPLKAAEVVTYYHNDQLGSPIAATDNTGAVVWEQAYDPWGDTLIATPDNRAFTGNWKDPETGLSDHKARWHSTRIGRFTSIDPVSFHPENIQSFNRYAYGNNNPYSMVDPDGERAWHFFRKDMSSDQALMLTRMSNTTAAIAVGTTYSAVATGTSISPVGALSKFSVKQALRFLGSRTGANSVAKNVVDPKRTKHIFRDKKGHLSDTPRK